MNVLISFLKQKLRYFSSVAFLKSVNLYSADIFKFSGLFWRFWFHTLCVKIIILIKSAGGVGP